MPISTAPPVADKTPWHPSCVHQFLRATLPSLRVQPRHLLPAGMEITSYNHHAKAPSSLGALVLKPRLPGRSSLRSYPINFHVLAKSGVFRLRKAQIPTSRKKTREVGQP